MNQTKKRLSIINLAISITDIETIQLQILKLGLLKTDEKIQEILSMLQQENYAQAQALISTYIDTPNKEVLQRTFQKEKETRNQKESAVIDEFDLFSIQDTHDKETEIHTLNLDDMLKLESETTLSDTDPEQYSRPEEIHTLDLDDMLDFEKKAEEEKPRTVHETVNFDSLLNVDSEDIFPDNIDIDISHSPENDFWETKEKHTAEEETLARDTFFDTEESEETDSEPVMTKHDGVTVKEEITETFQPDTQEQEEEIEDEPAAETEGDDIVYKVIPYIDQKFKNMQVQYPLIDASNEVFESVDTWLVRISNKGYTEKEIEAVLEKVDELRSDRMEEAAQLLLISAATESKYAQFRLARTLYKGDILQKNLPEAFTIINRLATYDDYPEAICDLAQFYEYGIGIPKDRNKAQALYEEAMDAGIKRAEGHFARLKKENSGFFSFLTK